MNTRLEETQLGWTIVLREARLGYIHIDFRLGLDITDASGSVNVTIETSCRLRQEDSETTMIPENTPSVSPMLALFNAEVDVINIQTTGELAVEFTNGTRLDVSPDREYEAWQIACPNDFLVVCAPGGTVTVFQEAG